MAYIGKAFTKIKRSLSVNFNAQKCAKNLLIWRQFSFGQIDFLCVFFTSHLSIFLPQNTLVKNEII